ncbi:hypothetical protein [Rhodococcus sp. NPDC049939]|uniref:hypothetical protein n=1 Tax=Rhodococcus sp. NPDC049939 TaxID=3155511 RepID=UPI00340CBFDA
MKRSARTGVTAVLAAPLFAAVFAAPASAGEHDDNVTLSAVAEGSDVTVTIENNHNRDVRCDWTATNEAEPDNSFTGEPNKKVKKNKSEEFVEQGVADGSYVVTWECHQGELRWGTDGWSDPATAEPVEFTVGDGGGTGTGSLGSLGNLFGSLDFGSLGGDSDDNSGD